MLMKFFLFRPGLHVSCLTQHAFVSIWRENGFEITPRADVAVDPSVTYTVSPSGFPNPPRTLTVPGIDAPAIGVGGTIAPVWSGGLGQPSVLAASLPGPRLPSPWGDLLLDPGTIVALYVGPAIAAPPGVTLPPAFRPGVAVTIQGLVALPNEVVVTNAQTLVIR